MENNPIDLEDIIASDFESALGNGVGSIDGVVVAVSRIGVSDGAVFVGRVVVVGRSGAVDGLVVADGLTVLCGLGVSEYIDAIRLHEVRKTMPELKSPS